MGLNELVPTPPANLKLLCAIINFIPFVGGVGTIIAGVTDKSNMVRDIIIGILQVIIPVAGYIWSVVWGIVMIMRK